MSNMSYCRFENTLADLQDCYDHLDDELENQTELVAQQELLDLCKDIAMNYRDCVEL